MKKAILAAALICGSGLAATKGPDAGNYSATDAAVYSFVDAAGGGGSASVLAGTDDGVVLLTLPFPFQYYGKSYTLVCASVNGLVSFVTSAAACTVSADFANTDLSSTAPPGDLPALLPYWTDLTFQQAGGGAVFYQTTGTPGSRRFVIEWSKAYPQGSINPVTFELVLYEGSNQILFQYQAVDLGPANPASKGALSTVGIRDSGGNATNRQIAWSYNAAVIGNSSAILFTPPAGSTSSVNTITTVPPGLSVTIDGAVFATPKVVSWTPETNHTLSVVSPVTNGGTRYTLLSWSTGATTPQISVKAGVNGTTYTANFSTEYQLTTGVNPANGGTVTGAAWYPQGGSAQVQATASANFSFAYFSGGLTGAGNPQTVTMTGPKNVVANFQSAATPVLTAAISGKVDGAAAGQRVWTIRLSNTGSGAADGVQITGLSLAQVAGAPCSPVASVVTVFPVAVGTIAAGANATGQVTLALGGCTDTAARFTAKVSFAATNNAYTGSTTINNQTR